MLNKQTLQTMKALSYRLVTVVLVLLSTFAFAQEPYNKKFHEEYEVGKSTLFEISNKFGNIKIENTTENKITIDAEIIVNTNSQEKADKIMNKIKVTISKTGDVVSAKTELDDINSGNANFEINYRVLMPSYLNINLENKYGGVTIDELTGKSNLAVKYGSLNVKKILDGNDKPLSTIDLGYCDHSQIDEMNWGKLIIKYSELKINSGKALVLASKYSKLSLGKFSSIVGETGYDEVEIGDASNIVFIAKYTDIEVENLSGKLKLDNKYGDVEVKRVPAGFENIEIVSKYANIRIGLAAEADYQLEVKTSYADIQYGELKINQRIKDDFSMEIFGQTSEKAGTAKVKIESEYGDVDIRP